MNPKQIVPLAVRLAPAIAAAPPLLLGGAIGLGIVLLIKAFSDSDKENQPDATPNSPEADAHSSRKPAETAVLREIPASPPPSVHVPPAPQVATKPNSVPVVSVAVRHVQQIKPIATATPPATPKPIVKKFITRADMAMIFGNGNRALTRTAAVAALKRLGFGKTSAYSALSPDGRFSGWMVFASDGIIYWTDGLPDK
jgi:hypothetical protein